MSGFVSHRLDMIEAAAAATGKAGPKAFAQSIVRIADRYPEDAAHTPARVRRGALKPAHHLAWALRFGTPLEFEEALDDMAVFEARRSEEVG